MEHAHRPIILTIVFGLLCGLLFLLVMQSATRMVPWMFVFRLLLWGYLASYAVGLAEWGTGPITLIVIPLFILLSLVVLEHSHNVFLLIYLGTFAVIRSSVFQPPLLHTILLEGVLNLGGGALIYSLNPQTNVAWALGIWMFFLIQSLYFVVWRGAADNVAEQQAKATSTEKTQHINHAAQAVHTS
jgi:hypothetical protein